MKLLLKNEDGSVYVKSGGVETSFQSPEEFLKYTGLDISGILVLTYEPLRGFHTEFDGLDDTQKVVPHTPYDDILDNIQVYIDRQADPYYSLEGQEIIDKDEELAGIAALQARVTLLEEEQAAANIRDITPQQAKNWIDAQFAAASTNAEVVQAVKLILKKMVVFLLR